jgi:hypothetical protein
MQGITDRLTQANWGFWDFEMYVLLRYILTN